MDIITSNPIPSSPSKVNSTLLASDAKKRQMSNTPLCKKKNPGRYQGYFLQQVQVMILTYTICMVKKTESKYRKKKKKLDKYLNEDEADPLMWCMERTLWLKII